MVTLGPDARSAAPDARSPELRPAGGRGWFGGLLERRVLEPVRRAQGSPGAIARGSALGVWVALTPTVGVQMLVVSVLGIPLRANIPVAIAVSWISNVFTMIPMYFAYYWFGALILGMEPRSFLELNEVFSRQIEALPETGVVNGMLALGWDVVRPMWVGSLLMATLAVFPSYHLTLRWARRRRARSLEEDARKRAVQDAGPVDA